MEESLLWIISEIIAALTGGSGVVYTIWYKIIPYLRSKIAKESYRDTIEKWGKTYDVLQSLLTNTKACRVLLIRTENGGGIPSPGKSLYCTVLAELFQPNLVEFNIKQNWHKRLVDKSYIEILNNLLSKEHIEIITKNLEKKSVLRDLYEASNIKFSDLWSIGVVDRGFIYLSIKYTKESSVSSSARREEIRAAVSKLRDITGASRILKES